MLVIQNGPNRKMLNSKADLAIAKNQFVIVSANFSSSFSGSDYTRPRSNCEAEA